MNLNAESAHLTNEGDAVQFIFESQYKDVAFETLGWSWLSFIDNGDTVELTVPLSTIDALATGIDKIDDYPTVACNLITLLMNQNGE